MKKNIMYGFLLLVSIALFTACGTDQKENPPQPDGPYSFFNATTPIEIKRAVVDENGTTIENGTYTIAVQLLKNGLVESGEIVQMLPFDLKYGFVTNIVVSTGENGYAVFTYVPPENYSNVIGQDITIQAVYLDSTVTNVTSDTSAPTILLTQDFVLQFR